MKNWQSYRQAIVDEFNLRKERSPDYSLRAYARDLGMLPSHLSDVISHRRGLSTKLATSVAEQLSSTTDEKQLFIDLVEMEDARSAAARELASVRVAKRRSRISTAIPEIELKFLENWHTPAVLELITIGKRVIDPARIAEKLAISISEAAESVAVLRELKLIAEIESVVVRARNYSHFISAKSNQTLRKFHQDFLKLIDRKIDETSPSERQNLTTVLSFDSARLRDAREFLEKSQAEFMAEFGNTPSADSVFVHVQHLVQLDKKDL